MHNRHNVRIAYIGMLLCWACMPLILSGYDGPRDAAGTGAFAEPNGPPERPLQGPAESISPSPIRPFEFGTGISTSVPIGGFIDHTRDGCPPKLLAKATKVLGEPVIHAWGGNRELPARTTKRQYHLITASGKDGIFLEKDGDYVYVNSQAELLGINEILRESKFTRQDFSSPRGVDSLLTEIAGLHQGPRHCPGSSVMLKMTMGEDSAWLRGTEKSEAVLHELAKDPEFSFEGNTWTVVFNVFKADGGVDRWKVIGEHDPEANRNQVLNIEVTPLKPAGTFSWPFLG